MPPPLSWGWGGVFLSQVIDQSNWINLMLRVAWKVGFPFRPKADSILLPRKKQLSLSGPPVQLLSCVLLNTNVFRHRSDDVGCI